MARHLPSVRSLGLAVSGTLLALTSLLPACTSASSRAGSAAFDDYSHGFAASQPKSISSVLEVTAPRMDPVGGDALRVSSADATRSVRVKLLDADRWQGVRAVWIDTGEKKIPTEVLAALLSEGVSARAADVKVKGGLVLVRLSDVTLPNHDAPAEWVNVTLDFAADPSSSRGLVAMQNSSLNHVPGIGFVGGD